VLIEADDDIAAGRTQGEDAIRAATSTA